MCDKCDENLIDGGAEEEKSPFLDRDLALDVKIRYLPHWHQDSKYQFVTFHLHDSIPKNSAEDLRCRRDLWLKQNQRPFTRSQQKEYNRLFSNQVEAWLDKGYGCCVLRDRGVAEVVARSLEFFDGEKLELISYVVMPNHVHVLLRLYAGERLERITKSWKSFTAVHINRMLNRHGQLWHHESWDTIIRNEDHYYNVLNYIHRNVLRGGVIWK